MPRHDGKGYVLLEGDPMPRISRHLGVLLVSVNLFVPVPLLAQDHGRHAGAQRTNVGSVADTLSFAWRSLTRLFAATGSGLDPNGATAPPPPPQTTATTHATDNGGSRLDLNG